MAKNTSRIGKREENRIRDDLRDQGYKARRQPGSGNRATELSEDVLWHNPPIGRSLLLQSKFVGYDKNGVSKERWKTLLTWMEGAEILCVRAAGKERYAFLRWDLLLALVGDAAVRDDLSALEAMEQPTETAIRSGWLIDTSRAQDPLAEQSRRQRIQSAHQNPKPKPAKPNKLRGRGFGK